MKKLLAILLLAVTSLFPQSITGDGSYGDPYTLYTAEHVDSIRHLGNWKWIVLNNSIDLVSLENWVPIPNFNGQLDGAGWTLSNLTIDTTLVTGAPAYIGFFNNFAPSSTDFDTVATVKNLKIDNFNFIIDGEHAAWDFRIGLVAGALTGRTEKSLGLHTITITNSSIDISSSTNITGEWSIGGAIGYMLSDTEQFDLFRIYIDADITFTTTGNNTTLNPYEGMGGIAGGSSEKISECAFVGKLQYVNDQANGNFPVGGITGRQQATTAADSLINCYVRMPVLRNNWWVGGLIGYNDTETPSVKNSYAQIDTLDAYIASLTRVGGLLVGYSNSSGAWESCYADTENVDWMFKWSDPLFDDYYRDLKSSQEVNTNGQDTAKTTVEMGEITTFVGWDFDDVWEMDAGYPKLIWIELVPPITLNHPDSAGIVYREADTTLVRWIPSQDTTQEYTWLDYSTDGGASWINIDTLTDKSDTSYSWIIPGAPTTQGKVRVSSELGVADSSSNNFTILSESTLDILYPKSKSGGSYTISDTLHINIESSFVENMWFHWSGDSLLWTLVDSIAVDTTNMQYLDTTTYVWTFTETISGPDIWLRVTEQADTTLYNFSRLYTDLGSRYPRGMDVCQTDSGGTLIEHFIYFDVSCGWTQPAHTYYNIRIGDLGESYSTIAESFAWPYENAAFPLTAPTNLITGSDTVEVYLNGFYTQYGTTVTYLNRLYYITNQMLYCDDLVNGITGIVVANLSAQYTGTYPWTEGEEMLQVYNVQWSKISGEYLSSTMVFETLNEDYFNPKILISSNDEAYPFRTLTVDALPYPNNDNPAEDIQQVLTEASFYRHYFRGIHPKIDKDR